MNLTEVCIRKPVFAWMLMAATLVFGGIAISRIGISQYPDVDQPTISIKLDWEGASAEFIENDLIEPLEEVVMQVEGVRAISSVSRLGTGSITVDLELSRDVDVAMQEVQAKISEAQRNLPRGIDPPVVSKSNPEDNPIMWIALSGPFSRQVLADYARYRLKEKLQTIPGVGEVMMGGYLDRNVRIWLDAARLQAKEMTVQEVLAALAAQHVELPAGRLETVGREVSVRVLGEALDLTAMRQIIVRDGVNPVRLSDVAYVEDGFEDVRRLARVNGAPAQGLGIKKQRGSNAVAVADGVHKLLTQVKTTLPPQMRVDVNFDSTRYIRESVSEIRFELLLAVVLTALVCWLFLGSLSSTINVLLAIPMSLLGTIAVIYFLGFTLNTFTLLALSLAVGIVVDDAIMVLENIYRHFSGNKDRVEAARQGTAEISFAALAATLAVVAIFLPVIFMDGVIGRFFLQFGITLSVAVLLSYVEAITLAPARCAQLLKSQDLDGGTAGNGQHGFGSKITRAAHVAFDRLSHGYKNWLLVALARPWTIVISGVVLMAASVAVFFVLPKEFVPAQDQSFMMVRFQTATSSSLEETDALIRRAEAIVLKRPDVARAFVFAGDFRGGGVNGGMMFVTLKPPSQRQLSQQQVAAQLRRQINRIAGLRGFVMDMSQTSFTANRGFPIEFSVRGSDWPTLIALSQKMKETLAGSGIAVDVDSDYKLGVPELQILPDRQRASDMGVTMEAIASTINTAVGGVRAAKFNTNGRRIDVRVRMLSEQRRRPEDIMQLRVRARSGELIPLSAVTTQREQPSLLAVMRRDRERAVTITANVAPGHSQGEVLQRVAQLGQALPPGYHVALEGASVTYQESNMGLLFALFLGIVVAYMVLASQFNSFIHPLTILTILPLSVAGAAFALYISGQSLNMMSLIGILLLLGIVKKNSIILVDYTNQLRREGLSTYDALILAGPVRLRPILMTSIATLMAALPFVLGIGAGSEVRQPMGIAVTGGLVVSTVLSLLVVPAVYLLADRALYRRQLKHTERNTPRQVQPQST